MCVDRLQTPFFSALYDPNAVIPIDRAWTSIYNLEDIHFDQ